MSKLQVAADALNSNLVALPTNGSSVDLGTLVLHRSGDDRCYVYNKTRLGRTGKLIGRLRANLTGNWTF
jgi:hypothetical protein